MTSVAEIGEAQRETWDARATTVLRVALAGCGAVGSALLREIVARRGALARNHGIEIVLARVLVRDVNRRRDAEFDTSLLTNDVDEFLRTHADIVIEAIGGFDPAYFCGSQRVAHARLEREPVFV